MRGKYTLPVLLRGYDRGGVASNVLSPMDATELARPSQPLSHQTPPSGNSDIHGDCSICKSIISARRHDNLDSETLSSTLFSSARGGFVEAAGREVCIASRTTSVGC